MKLSQLHISILVTKINCHTLESKEKHIFTLEFGIDMEIQQLIDTIEQKSKRLISRVNRLEQENADLKKSVFDYLQKMENQLKEIENLKHQIKVIEVQKSISSDKKKLQRDIDKYIHLIDKCIANINAELISK